MKLASHAWILGLGLLVAVPVVASDIGKDTARWQQEEIDLAFAPIKSRADLQQHLRSAVDSPLAKLSPRERDEFIEHLVFTKKGLGSFSWLPIAGKLGVSDTYRLLALFGLQSHTSSVPTLPPVDDMERIILDIAPVPPGFSPKASMPNS